MKIIVGLGNPGDKYLKTRHNAGQFYLSKLRDAWSEKDFSEGKNALWLQTKIDSEKIYLIFPADMMNNSGASLKKTLTQLKLKPKPADVLVMHDDLDIEMGRVKLSFARSSAGHNGVESVIKNLKTDKFWRLRIGIGLPRATRPDRSRGKSRGKKLINFILKRFTPLEEKTLNKNFKKILPLLEVWLTNPDRAMSEINSGK